MFVSIFICWGLSCAEPLVGHPSEAGMIRLETLIELKFLNSSFPSCFSYRN